MRAMIFSLVAGCLGVGCVAGDTQRVYFGTTGVGEAKGIHVADFDPEAGRIENLRLAAEAPRPGFLTISPDGGTLYATSEIPAEGDAPAMGAVSAFAIGDDGSLRELGRRESGAGPCFVALDATGRTLLSANYGGGSVAAFLIGDDGSIGPRASFFRHEGSSTHPQRQRGPHAHAIYPGPDNRFAYAPDLGIDEVVIYALDPATAKLTPAGTARTPPGSGPRHMKFSPDGKHAFVLGELDLTVMVYARNADDGSLQLKHVASVLPDDADPEGMTCSEILVSRDGKFIHTANRDTDGRGRDTLSVLAVGGDGQLERIHTTAAEVAIPRNIQLSPDERWLLVAGQESGGVPVFRLDEDGIPSFTGHRADVPAAMCIVFREGN